MKPNTATLATLALIVSSCVTSNEPDEGVDPSGDDAGPGREERLPGLHYQFFRGIFVVLPDFASLAPDEEGVLPVVDISAHVAEDDFAYLLTGYLVVEQAGPRSFVLTSDDGSRLVLDGQTVIDNDGLHVALGEPVTMDLTEGQHELRLEYFERNGDAVLQLDWVLDGGTREPVQAGSFTTDPL